MFETSASTLTSATPDAQTRRSVVLLVDDEPNVLAGLTLHLRRRYEVVTASSGIAAIGLLTSGLAPSVVISDMNMPGINGALFLATVCRIDPLIVRVLLTGQADMSSAISAVNDGQVFRFLTKPCAPALLLSNVEAAVAQHDLLVSERVLLQETLTGSVEALAEVLALTAPMSFGRALRVKSVAGSLARAMGAAKVWEIEIAAMFSHLGHVTLPTDVAEKLYYGRDLTEVESQMVEQLPAVTERLLAHIPRLETVREILARVARVTDAARPVHDDATSDVRQSAQLLELAIRFTRLEAKGETAASALALLRARDGWYGADALDALQTLQCGDSEIIRLREIPIALLQAGMTLGEDLLMTGGQLLAPRGYAITDSFLQRCRNAREGSIIEPARVMAAPTVTPP